MGRYDDFDKPDQQKKIDKPKGEHSIREAAAMELPMQGTPQEPRREEISMKGGRTPAGRSAGESVSEVVDHIFQLPFRAQLGVLRTIAPKILGAMDARDRAGFLRALGEELAKAEAGEPTYDVRPPSEQDVPGPIDR
ncbi:MAG TPA: hypothetical protein VLQ93_23365 [Myxococcaceae bacterium]|nr:hypothetical protein [Myxococcaceae bacterium]